jgi:hypothetical protein
MNELNVERVSVFGERSFFSGQDILLADGTHPLLNQPIPQAVTVLQMLAVDPQQGFALLQFVEAYTASSSTHPYISDDPAVGL